MNRLGMPVSDDTILRHLKRHAVRNRPVSSRIVGIDDWSWRRSWRYGTIIVDLEGREVVDVLEDRTMKGTADWFRRHSDVAIVSRDRCGLYAQGAREGAPQVRQVADRFHLMQNLRLAIEEQMSGVDRSTGRALLPDAVDDEDCYETATHEERWTAARHRRHAHRQSRQAVFDMVHALRKQGLSFSEIARRTGYGRRSIAKWLTYDEPPDRRRATPKPTSPRCFEVYLAVRWKDGILRGRDLFDEIKQRGYIGSFSNLERLLASWRRTDKASNSVARSSASAPAPFKLSAARTLDPATGHVISPVVAAALCMKPRGILTPDQARKVDVLKQASPDFAAMRRLAMRFRAIFRSRDVSKLEGWVDDAQDSGILGMRRVARALRRDVDAVRNAIEFPWSNGQTEGQINRLKTLKRAMYGRAGAELLRARMLPIHVLDHHTN